MSLRNNDITLFLVFDMQYYTNALAWKLDLTVVFLIFCVSFAAESKKTVNHCDGEDLNCLSFSPTELCQGTVRDQNYYAVCRSVLADIGSRKGLLHSPPEENGFQVMLNEALTECIAAQTIRREEAIDLIVGLLRSKITAKRTS